MLGSDLAVEAAAMDAELKPEWARDANIFVEGALSDKTGMAMATLNVAPRQQPRHQGVASVTQPPHCRLGARGEQPEGKGKGKTMYI